MAHKPPKATLASSKGGVVLAELKKRMASDTQRCPNAAASKSSGLPSIEEELKMHRRKPSLAQGAPSPKAKREKGREYIKISDPELRRAIIADVSSIGIAKTALETSSVSQSDLGRSAFDKLARLRNRVDGFAAAYSGGNGRPPTDDGAIGRRIALGSQQADEIIDADDGFFLGYDFGTSTTKAIARYPYSGIDNAFAIDVPASVSVQPHLWPTAVWFDQTSGRFSLVPSPNAARLHSCKEALIEGNGLRMCAGSGITMAHAAIGFLALHFAYCIGSAIEQHAKFRLAGLNVGVPVAALKATPTVTLFERVINAALFLVPFAEHLTLDDVKASFASSDRSRVQATFHTELAGAIAGYCAMPRPYVGGHMIIDCGSATLDMASFALDGASLRPVAIYEARVEHLGADACAAYRNGGATADDCRNASRYQEHLVFARTLQFARDRFAQNDGAFPYQVILVGGGIHSQVHDPLFRTMEAAFHRGFYRPELAPGLRYDRACEAGRLILADGLARDPIELRKVAMPGDPPPRPSGPEMVTKDQC